MARVRIEIDYVSLDKLLAMQCTLEECAAFFDISEDTIERAVKRDKKMSFKEYRDIKKQAGSISLRRAQWKKATEKLDTTMLIFLGKQYLGQTDKTETESNINIQNEIDFSKFTDDELRKYMEDDGGDE